MLNSQTHLAPNISISPRGSSHRTFEQRANYLWSVPSLECIIYPKCKAKNGACKIKVQR